MALEYCYQYTTHVHCLTWFCITFKTNLFFIFILLFLYSSIYLLLRWFWLSLWLFIDKRLWLCHVSNLQLPIGLVDHLNFICTSEHITLTTGSLLIWKNWSIFRYTSYTTYSLIWIALNSLDLVGLLISKWIWVLGDYIEKILLSFNGWPINPSVNYLWINIIKMNLLLIISRWNFLLFLHLLTYFFPTNFININLSPTFNLCIFISYWLRSHSTFQPTFSFFNILICLRLRIGDIHVHFISGVFCHTPPSTNIRIHSL